MNKQSVLLLLLLLTGGSLFAQTKRIAHRSHAGSDASFSITEESNFGLTPEQQAAIEKKKKAEALKKGDTAKVAVVKAVQKPVAVKAGKRKERKKHRKN